MTKEIALKIAAAILGGIAAFFWWAGNSEAAFFAGVAGAASFFLSVRSGSKARIDSRLADMREQDEKVEAKLTGADAKDDLAIEEDSRSFSNEKR